MHLFPYFLWGSKRLSKSLLSAEKTFLHCVSLVYFKAVKSFHSRILVNEKESHTEQGQDNTVTSVPENDKPLSGLSEMTCCHGDATNHLNTLLGYDSFMPGERKTCK